MRNDRCNRSLLSKQRRFGSPRPLAYKLRGSVSAQLVIGLLIIAFGVIYLAGNLNVINGSLAARYFFPAAMCAIGLALIISPENSGRRTTRTWGFVWFGLGIWWLAYKANWIDFSIWDIAFPLLLLFIGARLVQRAMNGSSDGPSGDQTRAYAFLSGSEMRTFTKPIKNLEVVAILSGIKIDLTNAQMEGERATLSVTAIMGGVELFAPSDWNVVSEVTPILGAYVDKRRPTSVVATKTLFISGMVVMGGVEVKN